MLPITSYHPLPFKIMLLDQICEKEKCMLPDQDGMIPKTRGKYCTVAIYQWGIPKIQPLFYDGIGHRRLYFITSIDNEVCGYTATFINFIKIIKINIKIIDNNPMHRSQTTITMLFLTVWSLLFFSSRINTGMHFFANCSSKRQSFPSVSTAYARTLRVSSSHLIARCLKRIWSPVLSFS